MTSQTERFDARYVRAANGVLREFNDAGVLESADLHVAQRLTLLAGEDDPDVALALALAVRGPRLGHVFIDLASIRDTVGVDSDQEADLAALKWPDADSWAGKLADSVLVADEERGLDSNRPLRLSGRHLYLDRYWRQEVELADDLRRLSELEIAGVDEGLLSDGLGRLFAGQTDTLQALAAATAVLNRFSVVAGGPGTGKTTTVARITALVCEQANAAGERAPLVALSAPTGKAAARLEESVREEGSRIDTAESVRKLLGTLSASTLHRLLGWRPASRSRFRHGRSNRLPHDLVIVDEASMVSLSMMASIVEAVRPEARLVLIGDPGQLTSIEAGAVLGDIVGPAVGGLRMSAAAKDRLEAIAGTEVEATESPGGALVGNGIVVLRRVYRFGESIGALADAIRIGDADAVVDLLADPPEEISWIGVDAGGGPEQPGLTPVRSSVVETARTLIEAADRSEAANAIEALGGFRLLCAHRRGDYGVVNWTARIEGWLGGEIETFADAGRWYVGRPLLVTANDYSLRLYNGDIGVIVRRGESVAAAFERGGDVLEVSPSRLESVQTAYAMTIHKSQGSQFGTAAIILPPPESRILTRELLYTAVTRAEKSLVLVGTEDSIRAAVDRPVARASGLGGRLWDSRQSGVLNRLG